MSWRRPSPPPFPHGSTDATAMPDANGCSGESEKRQAECSAPPRSMSTTLPTCETGGQDCRFGAVSPPQSPVACTLSPMRHRAATRPPEPIGTPNSAAASADAEDVPPPLLPTSSTDVWTQRQPLRTLVERFMELLSPSTERLVRLRVALRGLRDSLGPASPPPLSSSSASPIVSSPASPSPPHEFLAPVQTETVAGPPRLCVTGVSDVDVDEVFQFLQHRDATSSSTAAGGGGGGGGATAAHSGSAVFGHGGGGRSGLSSTNSALRPPTPDSAWVAPSHASPGGLGSQRRSRVDLTSGTAAPVASTAPTPTAATPGVLVSTESPSFPGASPSFSAATAVSLSGLFSVSNVALSDGAPDPPPLTFFPTTPPPPPSSTGLASRLACEVNGVRGGQSQSPRLTDSPSLDQFALPTLHHRAESMGRKVVTLDLSGETPLEAMGPAPLTSVLSSSTTLGATAAGGAPGGGAPSVTLAGAAGSALRVSGVGSSSAATSGQLHALSPYPPLLVNVAHVDGGASLTSATALHASPSPPLPAAPANHNLRSGKAVPLLESRALSSPADAMKAFPPSGDAETPALPLTSRADESVGGEREKGVMPTTGQTASTLQGSGEAEDGEEAQTANLSSTMPDLGETPPPSSPPLPPAASPTAAAEMSMSPSHRHISTVVPHAPLPLSPSTTPPRHSPSTSHHRVRSLDRRAEETSAVSGGTAPSTSPGERLLTSPTQQPSSSMVFRRRTTQLQPVSTPKLAAAAVGDSPTTPTPIVAVLLHRTASQYSETSDHQRSFPATSPLPVPARFNTLPTPFFSRVSGAASSVGRSVREDSTLLSPGSSFSPGAARFVQRLRRRTVAATTAQLHFTVRDLFFQHELTERDWTLLQGARLSMTAAGSSERVVRGGKGGNGGSGGGGAAGTQKRGGHDAAAGTGGGSRHTQRRSSPQLFGSVSTPAMPSSNPPWMVAVSEDGVLRYERPPTLHASPPFAQAPPITSTADYSFLCIPYEGVSGLTYEDCASTADVGAETVHSDALIGVVGDTEELTRALNLLFGVFAGWRQRPRSAAPAPSILVTADPASGNVAAAGASASPAPSSSSGAVCAGVDAAVISMSSSPPLSLLASPSDADAATFVFPALGRAGSTGESSLRPAMRSWRKTPSPAFEKAAAAAAGRDGAGRLARGPRTESARQGRTGATTASAAHIREATVGEARVSGGGIRDDSVGPAGDSNPLLPPAASHEAVMEEWLGPLRQALVDRTVFVLVRSESASAAPVPLPLPPATSAHSPRRSSAAATAVDDDAAAALRRPATAAALPTSAVVELFTRFAKVRYGVTVPSWRVVVFSPHESVITRNFLLSYYAHTCPSRTRQQQNGAHRASGDEVRHGGLLDSTDTTPGGWANQLSLRSPYATATATTRTAGAGNESPAEEGDCKAATPLLLNTTHNGGSFAGHNVNGRSSAATPSPARSVLSPLAPSLAHARRESTPAVSSGSLSGGGGAGGHLGSRGNLIRSSSRINLTSPMRASGDGATPTLTPILSSHLSPPPTTLPAPRTTVGTPPLSSATSGETEEESREDDAAGEAAALFATLARGVHVPPLGASLAAYTSVAAQAGHSLRSAPHAHAFMSPPEAGLPTPAARVVAEGGPGVVVVPPSPAQGEGATSPMWQGKGHASGAVSSPKGLHNRVLSLSASSDGRRESDVGRPAKTDADFSERACHHALQVMWKASGAAALNSAFRAFEYDAARHRGAHGAFSLMAWAWQLGATLPAIVKEAQQRYSNLRNNRRRTRQRLEGLQKSVDMHVRCSPAANVAAMETRLQSEFSAMTQRFAHDVRRLLTAPSSALTAAPRPHPSRSHSATSTAPSSASSHRRTNPPTQPQAAPVLPISSLDALRVYDSAALREAYRRLVYHVLQFREFYIHGQLPAEACGAERSGLRETGETDMSSAEETAVSAASTAAATTSLYEAHYRSLRVRMADPPTPTSSAADATRKSGRGTPKNAADGAAAHRTVSPSSGTPPPRASAAADARPRSTQSAPPAPRLESQTNEEAEVSMPRVDRGAPRERRVSLIASVGSSTSASALNESAEAHPFGASVAETTVMMPNHSPADAAQADGAGGAAAAPTTLTVSTAAVLAGEDEATNNTPIKKNSLTSRSVVLLTPEKSVPLRAAELQQRRLFMEHQLIAHVSQINTELINFFLATCVAAVPHIQRNGVAAEVERVRTAHAEMYSAFTTAVHGRKDAAMNMSHMYGSLDQWSADLGPLVTMLHSRQFLEKFIAQLRAVLCEDQIRSLAAYRDTCDGTAARSRSVQTAQLTNENLNRHCNSTATMSSSDKNTEWRRGTVEGLPPRRNQRKTSATSPLTADNTRINGAATSSADGASPAQAGVALRSVRLLLYHTQLATRPPPGEHGDGGARRARVVDVASLSTPSLRPARPTSATSTATTLTALSRRRGHNNNSGGGGLEATVSLTSMSAAWNREDETARSAAPAVSGTRAAGLSEEIFFASPRAPCMATIAPQILRVLSGKETDAPVATPPSPQQQQQQRQPARGGSAVGRGRPRHASADTSDVFVPTSSLAAASPTTATTTPLSPQPCCRSSPSPSAQKSTSEASVGHNVRPANEPAVPWLTRLSQWRSRMSETERPHDISGAPLLWLVLDTWDEMVLRFPYGLLLHLDTARYADSLNALSTPVVEAQRTGKARLSDAATSTARQLAALEQDMGRLQGPNGEVSADYVKELKSIFDDAAALVDTGDDAVRARFFS